MSFSGRNHDNRLSFGTKMNPLVVLIALSMIIFVVLALFRAFIHVMHAQGTDIQPIFEKNILTWFALPAGIGAALPKAWTLITHSFVHLSFWQLVADLLWLWCFGYIFIDLTGNRRLIPIFLYGTVAGGIGFLIATTFLAASQAVTPSYFYGSGAGVLAVCMAGITISPQYKILPMLGGGISLWIIGIVYLVIDMATIPAGNPAVHIAHLSGALAGFLFIYVLRRGFDGSDWMNRLYDGFNALFNPEPKITKRKPLRTTSFQKSGTPSFVKTEQLSQKRLDEILDKINLAGGYQNLSEEEKEYLKNASKKDVQQ